jgi:NADH-quinone oxidoreductase subunit L
VAAFCHHEWLPFAALGLAFGGLALAWLEFGWRGAAQVGFVERVAVLKNLFAQRWYIDRFYRWFLDIVIYKGVSNLFTLNDNNVIDGGINGLGKGTVETGRFVSFLHSGMVQYRLLVIFIVMVLLAVYFLF